MYHDLCMPIQQFLVHQCSNSQHFVIQLLAISNDMTPIANPILEISDEQFGVLSETGSVPWPKKEVFIARLQVQRSSNQLDISTSAHFAGILRTRPYPS